MIVVKPNVISRLLFVVIAITTIAMTVGCGNDLYIIDADVNAVETEQDITIEGFEYTYNEDQNAVQPSDMWFSKTSRGVLFMSINGFMLVYNPEVGTLNTLCPDPLCPHQPYSGCPYGNCIFTNSIPAQYEDRLYYFVKDEYLHNEELIPNYIIYSTDLTGQKIEKHYETSEYMYGLTIVNGTAYFLENVRSNFNLLKAVDLDSGDVITISDEGFDRLMISSFICMSDRIYYILDNGKLYSCTFDLTDVRLEYDLQKPASYIYGRCDIGAIFWIYANVIYQFDTETKETTEFVSCDESLIIDKIINSEDGIYYQTFPKDTDYTSEYNEFVESIKDYNKLYKTDPETKETDEYILPDGFYLAPNASIIIDNLLLTMTVIENANTHMVAGMPYYAYDLKTGSLHLLMEVSGA